MAITKDQIVGLYVTIFDELPHEKSLKYWQSKANENSSFGVKELAGFMLEHKDAKENFKGKQSPKDFISHIYKTLLNKGDGVDESGKAYWVDKMQKDGISKSEIIGHMLNASFDAKYANSAAQNTIFNKIGFGLIASSIKMDAKSDTIASTLKTLAKSITHNTKLTNFIQTIKEQSQKLGIKSSEKDIVKIAQDTYSLSGVDEKINIKDEVKIDTPKQTNKTEKSFFATRDFSSNSTKKSFNPENKPVINAIKPDIQEKKVVKNDEPSYDVKLENYAIINGLVLLKKDGDIYRSYDQFGGRKYVLKNYISSDENLLLDPKSNTFKQSSLQVINNKDIPPVRDGFVSGRLSDLNNKKGIAIIGGRPFGDPYFESVAEDNDIKLGGVMLGGIEDFQ